MIIRNNIFGKSQFSASRPICDSAVIVSIFSEMCLIQITV